MNDDNAVAIIGMACRFPGAPDLAAYWDLIASGREGLTRFDDAELAARGVSAELRAHRNYVPVGAVIDGQDRFEPEHFGIVARDAELMDPQLRLLLECAWDALGDAGYRGGTGLDAVGVFTGTSPSDYLEHNLAAYRADAERDPIGRLQAEMGTLTDYFPQQIAYRLDLTGPAVAVQATCATSLVAVHTAAQALLSEECDAALAGGASLIVPQGRGYLHVPDAIFSADGRTRAFGAGATGMVHSQGVGVVVLRRLADALADGDPIYAVVRGSAVNHDGGGKAGFAAPSAAGRARVIAEALAVADIGIDAVDLIEAHGTATPLGDQIELAALAAVFADRTAAQPIALGSVKSNIGHTNSAAGIASLIKTALALAHRRIPATLHASPAHPDLERHRRLFEVVEHTRDWPERDGTRIAGVSSFGIGGANCHAVLEQAPVRGGSSDPDPRAQLVLVSAVTEAGCREQIAQADAGVTAETRADYAYTVSRGPHPESGWRAAALLSNEDPNSRPVAVGPVPSRRPEIVFAFPGAGAQYSGMGAGLYRDEPEFAARIDECAEAMQPVLNYDIRAIVDGRAPAQDVDDVRYGQPALFAVSVATAATLRHYGIEPDAVIGHSLGEYVAAVVAGALSLPDAARLVAVRSVALADTAPGAMLAITLGEEDVRAAVARYPEIALAAVNGPDACVVSGPVDAIETLSAALGRAGIRASRLRVNAALHSPAVAAAATALRSAAEHVPSAPATLPLYSTLTGRRTRSFDAEHWARHLREPVLFASALRAATAAAATVLVQVGPGSALAALARRNTQTTLTTTLTTLPEADERTGDTAPDRAALLTAVGQLWCTGATVDVDALHRRRRRTRLPAYPFQRRSVWIEPPNVTGPASVAREARSAQDGSRPQLGPEVRIEASAALAPSAERTPAVVETQAVSVVREPVRPTPEPVLPTPEPVLSAREPVWSTSDSVLPARDSVLPARGSVWSISDSVLPARDSAWSTGESVLSGPEPVWSTGEPVSPTYEPALPIREPAVPNGRTEATEPDRRPEPPTRNDGPQPATLPTPDLVGGNGTPESPAPTAVSGPGGSRTFESPEEDKIAALWEELLGERVPGAEADFFALGGTSLLATRMLDILNEGERTDIRMRELLAHSTVAAFAALLRSRRPASSVAAAPAVPEPLATEVELPVRADVPVADATFPLTRVQHAYWVGRSGAFGLSDVACHIYLEYDCDKLDLDRYEQAWNRAIRRHEMLRAVVTEDGRNQILAEVPEYRIRRHDLTGSTGRARADTLEDLRRRLSHRVHRPDRWPLFDVRAALLDDTTTRLFIGIDALICDAGSFLVLDRDLRLLYTDPAAVLPPLPTRFADYVAHTEARAESADRKRAIDYWRRRMDDLPGAPALPTISRTQTQPWFGRRADRLAPAEWQGLRRLAADHGVTPSAVLLTAYSDVLAAWSGDERFTLSLTLVDRPVALPGIDGAVGDFTTLLAHEVDRTDGGAFAERVVRTQRRLFDDIDHREYSALDLLAELSTRTGQRRLLPVVFTSALDMAQLVGGAPDLEWAGRIVHGVSQTPQVWLDHQAFVDAGGLRLQWDVLETVLDPVAADTAFASYVEWLRRLAADPEAWTVPDAGTRREDRDDDVAAAVSAIWAQVLNVEIDVLRPDSTFVGLGGDSVLAVRMATMVRTRLGVAVPVAELVGDLSFADLIELIAERRSGIAATAVELARQADPAAPFPLTPLQQAYWVGQQHGYALSYDSAHNYVDFRLTGIDPTVLDEAVRRQVERQPMLRAVFLPDGTQQVLPAGDPRLAALPIIHLDLRTANAAEIDRRLAAIRADVQRSGPRLDPWPFAVTAVRLPGDELSLHIVCSLLVADGWSVQLMFTELFTYLDEPNTVLPALTAHFGDYVETISRQRGEPEWRAQRDWWWERIDDLPPAPALPLAVPFDQVRPDTLERREFRVSGERMAVLRDRCAEYNITPTTAFATCWAAALARLAGHRRFLLNVLYLNRLHLPRDLDHAIGPYAGTVLLDIALPAQPTFLTAARTVQEAIATMLDHGQVTGVEVLRELARRRRDTAPQAPVVFHSTLGLNPPGGTPDTVGVRDFYQRVRTPQVALDMQVFQWDWDDSVVVNLDAVAELFSPGVLDSLFAQVCDLITALVDRPDTWTAPLAVPDAERPAHSVTAPVPAAVGGPPATETERAVAELWQRMVDVPGGLDRGTDFFTIGGDSVLAIRMLNRLRGELGLAVSPREFLADPTLAAVAAAARHEAAEPSVPGDCLVPLRDGVGRPLFLIHPTGGDVLCYVDLARTLDTGAPIVGIQDPELAGAPGPETIAELARVYEGVVRAHQPAGPYRIGGWSMGGIIAHEVARRLRAAGDTVEALILLDSNIADRIHHVDGRGFWTRYLGSLAAFLDLDLETATLGAEFDRDPDERQRAEIRRRLAAAGLVERGDPADQRVREDIFRRHLRALGTHHTGHLDGEGLEMLLVRADLPAPHNSGVGMGVDDCSDLEDLGWAAHTDVVIDTRPVAAHHYALLRPPAVLTVAHLVSELLASLDESEKP
ncbi:type I polyketide synthase [Nocardia barduliensis]|uniref:type I polyketide synthase n=1 Tax=Nocardia barduliensis TaxID=2736643 RepID=UPI001573BB63|nr:type I polyketide synthase [Nocardia barduliensis]